MYSKNNLEKYTVLSITHKMNVGFFVRHFTERGTEIAIYDYAHYNETILNNKSIIICFTERKMRELKFPTMRHSFEIIENKDFCKFSSCISNIVPPTYMIIIA